MVSTRHHPRAFPEPDLAPSRSPRSGASPPSSPTMATPATSKRSGRSRSTRRKTIDKDTFEPPTSPTETKALARTTSRARSTRRSRRHHYEHYAPSWLLIWLFVSLPIVTWDTLYVLLRPHTMPGGKLHKPFWTPYALYGTIDYVYGFTYWDANNGFTAAQATLNVVETLMYTYYLYVVAKSIDGGFKNIRKGFFHKVFRIRGASGKVLVRGDQIPEGVLVGFSAAVMTLSKTVLYWLNDAFSNFGNTGHNSWNDLLWLYVIPNGLWLVFPSIMVYVLGKEILAIMHGKHVKEE